MSAKLEKLENNTAELRIEIDAEKFEEGIKKAFTKNAGRFNVPGFRKGKAPRKIIEQYYGEGIFYEEAINILFPDAYSEAIDEVKIEPVDRPDIEVLEIGDGKNLVIKATVTVKPEVALGKYKGIKIKKVEYNVSDKEVDEEIEKYRERNARIITVSDRPVANGDIVTIDFTGYKDGVKFPGGEGTGYELTIGSGHFIPGFEEQLVGREAGDDFIIKVTFPDDYHAEDLRGADVEFKVKIYSIKTKELPEADDEFAKDVSEFDTLAEFKKDIKQKLTTEAENRRKSETERLAIEAVVEDATVTIPQCMIDSEVEMQIRNLERRLMQQGLNMEKYTELTGTTIDEFKNNMKPQAENQVKTDLVLEAIVKAEDITATPEAIEAEYESIAKMQNMKSEDVKKYIPSESVERELKIRGAVELIVANAKIK
ncbi:MAG: Trigger factor [Firmicutes bacterium ADurb.Bin193]|nr:MAG: Trigger factor [Firmicutes bacterium ADurb.Bin193]